MGAWEGKHDNHKCTQNPPFILRLFAEHAIIWYGTSLWAFWVSCPGSVCSHLAHKVKKEKALVLCKHVLWQPKHWCVINAVGHKSRLQHHTGCYEASSPARPLRWDSNQTRKVGNLVSYLVLCSPVVILFQQTSLIFPVFDKSLCFPMIYKEMNEAEFVSPVLLLEGLWVWSPTAHHLSSRTSLSLAKWSVMPGFSIYTDKILKIWRILTARFWRNMTSRV